MTEQNHNKKVLIVDDEPFVRQVVRRTLGKQYTILEAGNGEEAVSVARSQSPDLILMDLMMPKMDGYTSCHRIKKDPNTRRIPVIMLSALDYELNVKLSRDLGADGYMAKPFSPRNLLDTINLFLLTC